MRGSFISRYAPAALSIDSEGVAPSSASRPSLRRFLYQFFSLWAQVPARAACIGLPADLHTLGRPTHPADLLSFLLAL